MAKPSSVEIGENTFYVDKLGAFDALKVFGDLQKDLLPALGGVMAENQDISASLARLSENLGGDQLEYWAKRLLDNGTVAYDAGTEALPLKFRDFDAVFADFSEIIELLVYVIRENFEGPLRQWLKLFDPIM